MDIFHSGAPHTFLGVQNQQKGSKYTVLSAPYDSTVSYRTGTREGPRAIIEASRQVETYDIELGRDFADCGIFTAEDIECDRGSPQRNCGFVQEAVAQVIREGKIPVLLGGEHSVSVGAFDALSEAGKAKSCSVLQIDAHADMRNEYEGTKYSHACAMARCREKLHAVSVGIRSYSQEEAQEIKSRKLEVFGMDFDAAKVAGKLKEEVYITIDLDGLDPSEAPGVGTPEPGGLHYGQLLALLREVCSKRRVIGFDIVELAPIAGQNVSEFLCARLAYKLICYIEANRR